MSGLAARLGMRRSPSGLDTTGTLRLPPRVVSPLPPYDPEPMPDEPFAPVYEYVPLEAGSPARAFLPVLAPLGPPRDPDALVFGAPGSGELQAPRDPGFDYEYEPIRRCAPCVVQWRGNAPCWRCAGPATEI